MEVENFLEYICIPKDRKVKLVAFTLKGRASSWWERLKLSRSREGKLPVTSWSKMKWLLNARFLPPDDYGNQREPFRHSYGDWFVGGGVNHNSQVQHHLHKSPNRPFTYEEKFVYDEDVQLFTRVEMLSKKKYVQPPPLFPMTTSKEEPPPPPPPKEKPLPPQEQSPFSQVQLPPPIQLVTFTTKGDIYCEENNEVEEDIHEGTNGGTFMEVEENEESCHCEVYVDFSNYISAGDVNNDETGDDIPSYDAMDTIVEEEVLLF
jgi:hypothetical protein